MNNKIPLVVFASITISFVIVYFVNDAKIVRPDESSIPRNSLVDIKVLDDPFDVADLEQKAVDFLNNGGFTRAGGGAFSKAHLEITDVEYAITCISLPG